MKQMLSTLKPKIIQPHVGKSAVDDGGAGSPAGVGVDGEPVGWSS